MLDFDDAVQHLPQCDAQPMNMCLWPWRWVGVRRSGGWTVCPYTAMHGCSFMSTQMVPGHPIHIPTA